VLRDILYISGEISDSGRFDSKAPGSTTNAVFHVLRNAGVLKPNRRSDLVICWGGHAISREEYDYTKAVGYELGLRGLHVCTGCGPGAMKGPMKGAAIAHAKQRIHNGRYIGISEPGIIAAESPNPIVNDLVIMPDIEKRLEAFVRAGHGVLVFPGGAGTAEEVLYLLGILMHPDNAEIPFPLVFTGLPSSEGYFCQLDRFLVAALGPEVRSRYRIIVGDPPSAGREIKAGFAKVYKFRRATGDAFYFNWVLTIEEQFQKPFVPSHENMARLVLHDDQDRHMLAANLRRVFSGIVAGNVKDEGIRAIERHGPFEIRGSRRIMRQLDELLSSFVKQRRMRLPGSRYEPCYRLVG
jgi:predicted Rossmann-fold nucleotide-binding protein